MHGLAEWLAREEGGMQRGQIEQRGAGVMALCQRCNNNTGSWYGMELVRAARSGVGILRDADLDALDRKLEPTFASVIFRQQPRIGPHPLRLIKQIVTMLLATSQIEFSIANPDLGDFVLDREARGLDDRYQFYLALFAGPTARTTGAAGRIEIATGQIVTLAEVAYPPFAYVLTVDSAADAIETSNITGMVDVGYNQMADLELDLLIGFGHTPYPADYRTSAMIERDRNR